MKILTIIGARPQFIKAAVVSRAMQGFPGVEELLVHTGQHYDPNMSDIFFDELQMPKPFLHLGVGSGLHGAQTAKMIENLEPIMIEQCPDWVLIYGDTNSTLAGAITAAKLHIPVAHVEAGLRSYNRRMPEEINRIVADHISTLLLAPTGTAVTNLLREGIDEGLILDVGDVMYDAALYYGRLAEGHTGIITSFGLGQESFILATIHRAENTDDPMRLNHILEGLNRASKRIPVILPLHPRTRKIIDQMNWGDRIHPNLKVVDPVGYLDMVLLEKHASLIVTDSGGVQKEAFFHGVPCVTLREETEWVELVELGWNRLAPPLSGKAVEMAVLESLGTRGREARPYGDGQSSRHIVQALLERRA